MSLRSTTLGLLVIASPFHPAGVAQEPSVRPDRPKHLAAQAVVTPVPAPPELAAIRARVEERIARGEAASIALAVARGGQTLWLESFGHADREGARRATIATPYPIASLTKSMTATALHVLDLATDFDLEAPVSAHLAPGAVRVFTGGLEKVSTRDLLEHRAGIPSGWLALELDAPLPTTAEWLREAVILAHPPGEFLYSNFAYGAAQLVLEAATERGYAEVLQEALFDALGLSDGAPILDARLQAEAATEYDGSRPLPRTRFLPSGAAGAYASVRDLLRYGQFFLGHHPPSGPWTEPLRQVQSAAFATPGRGPLGFPTSTLAAGTRWTFSNGRISGACSNLALFPEHDLVVVVLANAGTSLADDLATELAGALVPGLAQEIEIFLARWRAENEPAGGGGGGAGEEGEELDGLWSGHVETAEGALPFALGLEAGGAWAAWGERAEVPVEGLTLHAQRVTGSLSGSLPTSRGAGPMRLELDLARAGNTLTGSVRCSFSNEEGSFALPLFVTLERASER